MLPAVAAVVAPPGDTPLLSCFWRSGLTHLLVFKRGGARCAASRPACPCSCKGALGCCCCCHCCSPQSAAADRRPLLVAAGSEDVQPRGLLLLGRLNSSGPCRSHI
jgi:hypothetical protein